MIALSNAASIHDLRRLAKRRLPGFAFDFIDGGAEDEISLRKNRAALDAIELTPRYLTGAPEPNLETEVFGKSYSVPFGVAPVGFMNMAWPGADLALARLAAKNRMAHVVSTASSTSLEEIAEAAEGYAWFQLYVTREETVVEELLRRSWAAGYRVLVVTVDVPEAGKRDRDIRNGLRIPFRPNLRLAADLALHPRWSLGTLLAGPPHLANFSEKGGSLSLVDIQKLLISSYFDWSHFRRLRDKWDGQVLLKGILHPDDALRAVEEGCDGIVVSNHGGRQLDYGPASIAALPGVVKAVGDRVPLILDSGIRRGADAIRAKALGASFLLAGRAFAYGAAAGGEAGAKKAFEILRRELSVALGQLGTQDYAAVDRTVLFDAAGGKSGTRLNLGISPDRSEAAQ